MADLNARIKPKKSSTASEVPQAADLEVAELAVNTADGKLFTKHTDGSIVEISGGGGAVDSVNGDTGAVIVDLDSATAQGATTNNDLSVGDLLTVQGDGAAQDGRLKLNCSANTHGVTIQSPPHSDAATYTLTLPSSAGTAGQVLTSQGGSQLTWEDAASSPSPITGTAPTSTTDTGTAGELRFDADYLYVCIATDSWKRAALSVWADPTPLLFHFDESNGATTFANSGALGGNGTSTNSQISTTQFKFGTASFFSDSANSGTGFIPAASVPDLAAGDFTIDFWMRGDGSSPITGGPAYVASRNEFDTDNAWAITYFNGIRFNYSTDGGQGTSVTFTNTGSWNLLADTWMHVAVCREGDTLRCFLDGVEADSTASMAGVTVFKSTSPTRLGHSSSFGSPNSFFDGYIDELRITNTAEYTAGFTPPTAPYA